MKRIHPPKFLAYLRQYNQTRRAKLRARGLCVDCGERPATSRALCAQCCEDRRLRWKFSREAHVRMPQESQRRVG
jgi:hypothetical protein